MRENGKTGEAFPHPRAVVCADATHQQKWRGWKLQQRHHRTNQNGMTQVDDDKSKVKTFRTFCG